MRQAALLWRAKSVTTLLATSPSAAELLPSPKSEAGYPGALNRGWRLRHDNSLDVVVDDPGAALDQEPELVRAVVRHREFVLVPLFEIQPDLLMPDNHPIAKWVSECDVSQLRRIALN